MLDAKDVRVRWRKTFKTNHNRYLGAGSHQRVVDKACFSRAFCELFTSGKTNLAMKVRGIEANRLSGGRAYAQGSSHAAQFQPS